jgi:putative transposase
MAKANSMVKRIESSQAGALPAVLPTAQVLALRQRDPWREATDRARQVATWRETVVAYVRSLTDDGVSQNNAVGLLLERGDAARLPPHFAVALKGAAKAGRDAPSRSAICDWCAAYREGGISALLPDHKGRVIESAGWWGPALEYFNSPSKPTMSAVHKDLVEKDGFAVSYDQVRGYLTSVPAMYGRNSPARLGKNLYRLTEKAYIKRSTENALPGDVYVADGYRADVYLAHPLTGDIWRPELTVAMDMRSRYIVGWRADEHEGTYAVQNMWAEAFCRHNHVPPFLYVDNGSGHKNRLMSDESIGFYARAGIQQVIHAIPGNPHGKGWIERFFRIVRDEFLKLWMPHLYCGDDMAPEALNRTVADIKAGRLALPTIEDFTAAFNAWLARYHARPHPENKHVTRASVWADLVPIPPTASVTELKRQVTHIKVARSMIKHGRKRLYRHPDLLAFNGSTVAFEYDLFDNRVGIVRTLDGRWICDAVFVSDMPAIEQTRMDDKRAARADDALRRLEKKMDEQLARAGRLIDADADAVADGAALEGQSTRLLSDDGDDINIFED